MGYSQREMTRSRAPLAYLPLLALLGGAAHAAQFDTPHSATSTGEDAAALVNGTGGTPTDAQAQAGFAAAQAKFKAMAGAAPADASLLPKDGPYEVAVFSDPDKQFHPGGVSQNVALENIRVVMDVENESLRDVVGRIVGQAAEHTGEWTVKWRLKPENASIPDEHVNLTAEAPFGQFVDLLSERVRNMTGVQLYLTAYNESRVILVTDTYY